MKRILLAVLMLSSTSACAESYLCIADQAAGFSFNKGQKKWSATTFNATEKFIIKRQSAEQKIFYKNAAWVVTRFGSSSGLLANCEKDFNDVGMLFCEGIVNFHFNKKNMRFLSTFAIGYVSYIPGDELLDEGKNTPSMNIGACSLI